MSNRASLVTLENVTIFDGGRTFIIGKQYAQFQGIVDALKSGDYDTAISLANRAEALKTQSHGEFEVRDGIVYRNGQPIHNVVTRRIIEFQEAGLPFEPLVKFLENLLSNPSRRAVNELYTFLENRNLPITEDGHFLAYKAVQSDYRSKTAGTEAVRVSFDGGATFQEFTGYIPNDVGAIVEVERNMVDDDASRTCSYGLHAGALEYVDRFASGNDKKVVVKINPRDAVSVPLDHDAQKLRSCRYEVIADFQGAISQPLVSEAGAQFAQESPEVEQDEEHETCPDCGDTDGYFDGSYCEWCGYDVNEYEDSYESSY